MRDKKLREALLETGVLFGTDVPCSGVHVQDFQLKFYALLEHLGLEIHTNNGLEVRKATKKKNHTLTF